ncbi:hypothetical protein HU746_17955 [Pseudomonas lurida]|uniref:hypothetical protein n=1 Tax=Pseudomonas lurida TaxID=244566 RepID=UPI001648003A|nr:hypothetical protein [Pseudomonas lurida]MBC3246535.1 hypothetical protein [Pseudomonas lurida]
MTTKNPKAINMLLCEDIRQETGNKVSILGVYPDGLVFQTNKSTETIKLAIPQLAVYATFEPLTTDMSIKIRLLGPTGLQIYETPPGALPKSKGITIVAFKMVGIEFKETGNHKVEFYFNDHKTTFTFSVSHVFID